MICYTVIVQAYVYGRFPSRLNVTFEIKVAGILAALENGVSQVKEVEGRLPQVGGMKFTWDARAEPGRRIVEVMVDADGSFEALDPEQTYADVTAEYLAANLPYMPYVAGHITKK